MRLFLLITATMFAFAANSVLTRAAVDGDHMDPAAFAILRVLAGAITLVAIMRWSKVDLPAKEKGRFAGVISLTAYMIGFSLAYSTLDAGLGALILFGTVQITMFFFSGLTGQTPSVRQLTGTIIAFAGLMLALWPGAGGQADIVGAMWMLFAGVGWAAYTIVGRRATDPLAATGANFVLCLPLLAVLLFVSPFKITGFGIILGAFCGAITSGLGYALWYSILPKMAGTTAAIVQLSVPIIAILMGIFFLGEALTGTIAVAAALVVGGIAFAVRSKTV